MSSHENLPSTKGDVPETSKETASASLEPTQELTKAQARRLLLKTDLVVTPLAVISMTLAFLDKVSPVP